MEETKLLTCTYDCWLLTVVYGTRLLPLKQRGKCALALSPKRGREYAESHIRTHQAGMISHSRENDLQEGVFRTETCFDRLWPFELNFRNYFLAARIEIAAQD